jgi:hypothetical protein
LHVFTHELAAVAVRNSGIRGEEEEGFIEIRGGGELGVYRYSSYDTYHTQVGSPTILTT